MTSLKQTYGIKFEPDKPYMTVPEIKFMKEMIRNRSITIFRLKQCENKNCKNLIIESKRFCCLDCMEKERE